MLVASDCVAWQLLPDDWPSDLLLFCPQNPPTTFSETISFLLFTLSSNLQSRTYVWPLWFSDLFIQTTTQNEMKKQETYSSWAPSGLQFVVRMRHIDSSFDKLTKTKLRSSPTWGAWRWCKAATVRAENGSRPRPEGAIFKLDLTWWRARIWIRVNQFKFVRKAAPVLARLGLREGLVGWEWKRMKSKAATEIPFSNFCPEPFQTIAFLMSQSKPQQPQQFLSSLCNGGMSGTIHRQEITKEGHLLTFIS